MTGPTADAPAHLKGMVALRRVMADTSYRSLFMASTAVMASQWMQRIALGWIMWELTGSTTWLGLLALAELAPGLVFGPLGGVLADQNDRRKIIQWCQIALFAVALLTGLVVFLGWSTPTILIFLTVTAGIGAAVQESARALLIRDVTPADCLPTGMSMTAISVNVTRFVGPAMAGPLVVWPGPASIFWINAVVALIMIATVLRLRPIKAPSQAKQAAGFAKQLCTGFKAASSHAVVTPVLIVFAMTAFLVRPVYELMPAFADRLFGGNVQGYSYLVMGVGAGALLGAIIVTLNAPQKPARLFFQSSVGASVALICFSVTSGLAAATAATMVLGFFMCISAASSQLVMILDTEKTVSGRVLSFWGALMRGAPALGALFGGGLLDMLGYRTPLAVAGALAAGLSIFMFLLFTQNQRSHRMQDAA